MQPVDPNIRIAKTPDKRVYTDPGIYEQLKESAFARSWQYIGDQDNLKIPGAVWPVKMLEGCLDEPLVFTRDLDDTIRCMSNVCTHRGMVLCENAGNERFLRCRYHGRRFGLDGKFQSMPEFEGVEGFPSEEDNLPNVHHKAWERFLFASLAPAAAWEEVFQPMLDLVGWMPIREFMPEPSRTRDYLVRANWALYVDNYLEGFHIPFIHADLNAVIDYGNYTVHNYDHGILQLAVGKGGEETFDLPTSSPHYGQDISAYYFWFFPNLMFNFYPYGLSINVVRPLAHNLTRVSFIGYVWDRSKLGRGAGGDIDRVEREDEVVVELVQQGLQSRFYNHGRYSVTREDGTHHFHQMLTRCLQ